ncbi:metallophosphoesterase [Ponticaulis sp.]|uniref:metallophosphoesterase family protein n=1 Tax=Ponticaulis sp. TaxID=2020902 RepID=UPI000B718F13|nr:metallophosphoesterase [Ponticaulis sp.]MAI88975.1 hypothetical protein [Ponticaulis sp.]OUY01660.1 MAG: hypothetical protein CBB65_00650 [Hyphomonadaceae bacterium TMED5]|tara:strand:+ start:92628 stop:93398 length:771 start_codon:yes stop_codon:yes gene_type:complete
MIRLIQLADLHFGREHPQAMPAAIPAIESLHADGLIVAGDLTQRGSRAEFEAAENWLSRLSLPRIIVPGNHDTPLLNLYARVHAPFDRFLDRFRPQFDDLQLNNVRVMGLNTSRGWQVRRNWAEGSVNLEDLDDCIERADSIETPVSAIVCHHPFKAVPRSPLQTRTRRGDRASKRLARSPVKMLLTGHVHQPSVHQWREGDGQYLAIGAGTLSNRLRDWPPSFNEILIDDGHITVNAHTFSEGRFSPFKMGSFKV